MRFVLQGANREEEEEEESRTGIFVFSLEAAKTYLPVRRGHDTADVRIPAEVVLVEGKQREKERLRTSQG